MTCTCNYHAGFGAGRCPHCQSRPEAQVIVLREQFENLRISYEAEKARGDRLEDLLIETDDKLQIAYKRSDGLTMNLLGAKDRLAAARSLNSELVSLLRESQKQRDITGAPCPECWCTHKKDGNTLCKLDALLKKVDGE